MEQKTADCLNKADTNRDLAGELVGVKLATDPYGWIAVMAFYAAVHYVNAYLWERDNQYDPENHGDRTAKITSLPALRRIRGQYRRLNRLGWKARYDETARINKAAADDALIDLKEIETELRPYLK